MLCLKPTLYHLLLTRLVLNGHHRVESYADNMKGKKWGKGRQLGLFPGKQKKEEASPVEKSEIFSPSV